MILQTKQVSKYIVFTVIDLSKKLAHNYSKIIPSNFEHVKIIQRKRNCYGILIQDSTNKR